MELPRLQPLYETYKDRGFNVVVIDRGLEDGVDPGTVLRIDRRGETIRDVVSSRRGETVTLPDEQAGLLMVFRSFDRVSFGLVMLTCTILLALDLLGFMPPPGDAALESRVQPESSFESRPIPLRWRGRRKPRADSTARRPDAATSAYRTSWTTTYPWRRQTVASNGRCRPPRFNHSFRTARYR